MENSYVLVTGASKGIGYWFCYYYLKKGYNIIAVARNTDSIENLKQEFIENSIICLNLDLSVKDNLVKLTEKVQDYDVDIVINNAGYGLIGKSNAINVEDEFNIIDLNIKASQYISKFFINKYLNSKNKVTIVNIGSVAGFIPGPYFSSYYASKNYINAFSTALSYEYRKSNIKVICICPGTIKTEFWDRASNKSNKRVSGMKPQTLVKKSMRVIKKGKKPYYIIGFSNKLLIKFTKIIPNFIIFKIIKKYNINKLK